MIRPHPPNLMIGNLFSQLLQATGMYYHVEDLLH